ncbi:putative endonuclease or glycosyl hydrolase [Raphanus sativus]|nr:putative endonuclease or glycosyl hydrolase [Raphanus sativus]
MHLTSETHELEQETDQERMSLNRYEEAPPELRTAKTMVWWDIKSCPVPEGYDHLLVRRSIESVLSDKQYCGPLTIIALGNLEDIPLEDLQAYSSSGIVMKHDLFVESSCTENQEGTTISSIIEEVRRWTFFNPAPASIVFISNPRCLLRFSYQMNCLSTSEYNILFAFETAPRDGYTPHSPTKFLWKDLLKDAVRKSVWDQVLIPHSTGQRIEEKFSDVSQTKLYLSTDVWDIP